jgi:F-type H+-transporting ATPase subunit b
MPQLAQLSEVALSQFLWLALGLGFIFFVIGRGMVPKIQATVDDREKRIAADIDAAQQARVAADETEAAWRARMDAARAEAAKLSNEAKQASARDTETKVKKAADKLNLKLEASEERIRTALAAARSELEGMAAEVTQDLVTRLTGIKVDSKDAAAAVKAEMNG